MAGLFWNPIGAVQTLGRTGDLGAASNEFFGGWDVTAGGNITKNGTFQSAAPKAKPAAPQGGMQVAETFNPGTLAPTATGSGGVTYYSGGAAPAVDQQALAQYDQSLGILDQNLGRLGVQLDIAKGNVNRNADTKVNELTTAKKSNEGNYKTSSTQNQQSLRTNRNAIMDQQSAGLRGLMRQLGAYGAVGSDMQVAGGTVQDVASQQNSGAGQTFAQNQQGLDTNWNNYLSEWANSRKKVDDWRTQQLNDVESQSLTTRQDLLSRRADIAGQRAAAAGGNYAGGAAANLAEAQGLSGRIDNLGRINPTYDGTAPTYTAPELSSYMAPEQAQMSSELGAFGNNPAAARLLGLQQEERRRQIV